MFKDNPWARIVQSLWPIVRGCYPQYRRLGGLPSRSGGVRKVSLPYRNSIYGPSSPLPVQRCASPTSLIGKVQLHILLTSAGNGQLQALAAIISVKPARCVFSKPCTKLTLHCNHRSGHLKTEHTESLFLLRLHLGNWPRGPVVSMRSELLLTHEKLGKLLLLTVYVVPV